MKRSSQRWLLVIAGLGAMAAAVWLLRDRASGEGATLPVSVIMRPAVDGGARLPSAVSETLSTDLALSSVVPAQVEPLSATPPPRIAGAVIRGADGAPLRGLDVLAVGHADASGHVPIVKVGVTSASGHFELTGFVGDLRPVALSCTWKEMTSVTYYDVSHMSETGRTVSCRFELPPDDPWQTDLIIAVDTGWILSGDVLDESGVAVRAAHVTGPWVNGGYTRKDGHFKIVDIPDVSGPFTVQVEKKGFRTLSAQLQPSATGQRRAEAHFILMHE